MLLRFLSIDFFWHMRRKYTFELHKNKFNMLFFLTLSALIDSFYFLQEILTAFRILFNMIYLHPLLINGDSIFCKLVNFINPEGKQEIEGEHDEKLNKFV